MKHLTHIIRQHHLHVEVNGSEADGFSLQQLLPDLCRDSLLPAVEQALDRFAPEDGSLCIERLDIDLGTLDLERLEQDLPATASRVLEQSLRECIQPEEEMPAGRGRNGKVERKTTTRTVLDALCFFLANASLPWSFCLEKGKSLEQAVLAAWQEAVDAGQGSEADKRRIKQTLQAPQARGRLARQFSPAFQESLLSALSPAAGEVMLDLLRTVQRAGLSGEAEKRLAQQLRETAFARLATGQAVLAAPLLRQALGDSTADYPGLVKAVEALQAEANPGSQEQQVVKEGDESGADPLSRTPPPTGLEAETGDDRSAVDTTDHYREHPDLQEGIYIDNAGLVLLHPFLPQFFRALGIVKEDALDQPERALCLLHYLSTGQEKAPEYELVLAKILCNLPLLEPVDTNLELSEMEQEEARALLAAVIQHWQALRNTSPDGLRGTFLVRPGKISLRGEDLLLQVEPQTWDILLEQLPWGISMIRLPWMDRMLWVEWT